MSNEELRHESRFYLKLKIRVYGGQYSKDSQYTAEEINRKNKWVG